MIKVYNLREAVYKATHSTESVEVIMRGTKVVMKKNDDKLCVEYRVPSEEPDFFRVIDSFDCECSVGTLTIVQMIDMHYRKIKDECINICINSAKSLRKKANALAFQAKEFEWLIKNQ